MGVRGGGDSSILCFVDSKQMVKIFAHHKNIYCGVIFKFFSKSKQKFWNKSYLTMVRKNIWKDTYPEYNSLIFWSKINGCFIESIFFQVNVNIMGRSFKAIYILSHEKSNQSVKKCEGSILQKVVSIKLWKYCTCSYYYRRWLGENK